MKRVYLSVFVLFVALAFTACDDSHGDLLPHGREIAFTSGISGTTRVVDQTWSTKDKVGICMFPADGQFSDMATHGGFKLYQPTAGGSSVTLGSADPLYYPINNKPMHFVAFAPRPDAFTPTAATITYDVPAAQGTLANMESIDFVWATHTEGYNYSNGPVTLNFEHRFSKIEIVVKRGNGIIDTNFKKLGLTIDSVPTTVTCNLGTGTVTSVNSSNKTVTCYTLSNDGNTAVLTAIVPPHTRDHTLSFTNTGTHTYTLESPVYEFNHSYQYEFTLSAQGAYLTHSDVSIWGVDDVMWNGDLYLGADKELALDGEASSGVFAVKTNVEAPTVKVSTSSTAVTGSVDWFTLGDMVSMGNSGYGYTYTATTNFTHSARTAYIHSSVSGIGKIVTIITQEPYIATIVPNAPLLDIKDANCIIVPPGGAQALIPVSRVDRFYDLAKDIATETATVSAKIGTTEELFAELIWADGAVNAGATNGAVDISCVLNPGAVIQKVGIIGSGPSARVYVQSGLCPAMPWWL